MTGNAESYELTSGLPDDFDCEVIDAWFATDSRYNNGNTTLLFWKIETDDDEMPDEQKDGGIRFSCGSDWESSDGGATVEHPKGKGKFASQSAIGVLIARAFELDAATTLIEAGDAQEAAIWIGTKWHMKREAYESNIQGEKTQRERLLPNAFNGKGDSVPDASTSTPASEPQSSALDDLPSELVEQLKGIKADTPSHSAFVDKAMELTEVSGNSTLLMALADPAGAYTQL